MSCSLLRLPDEVLFQILYDVPYSFHDIWSLLRVCRRFHSFLINEPKMWRKFYVSNRLSPRQILLVAERSGYRRLLARVDCEDLEDIGPSLKTILELRTSVEDLRLYDASVPLLNAVLRFLEDKPMLSLNSLTLKDKVGNPYVPDVTPYAHVTQQGALPSLRALVVDFFPHPSMGRNLTRFETSVAGFCYFGNLLDFLEVASKSLQELVITVRSVHLRDEDPVDDMLPVSLPNLHLLEIRCMGRDSLLFFDVFKSKTGPWQFRRLVSSVSDFYVGTLLPGLLTSICDVQSAKEFTLSSDGGLFNWGSAPPDLNVMLIPRYVEILTIKRFRPLIERTGDTRDFPGRSLRRLCFENCNVSDPNLIAYLRDLPVEIGRDLRVEFWRCKGWKDGVFSLDALAESRASSN